MQLQRFREVVSVAIAGDSAREWAKPSSETMMVQSIGSWNGWFLHRRSALSEVSESEPTETEDGDASNEVGILSLAKRASEASSRSEFCHFARHGGDVC